MTGQHKTAATHPNFTVDLPLAADPATVFAAAAAPERWWAGTMFGGKGIVEGAGNTLGAEFDYSLQPYHFSRQRVVAFEPNRRLVWEILASELSFADPKDEWTGTRVIFDIVPDGAGSRLRFVHEGLTPAEACYDNCSSGWLTYLRGPFTRLCETGQAAA